MDWTTILSIASLILGGGIITWIFYAGSWMGKMETKVDQLTEKSKENPLTEAIDKAIKGHLEKTNVDFDLRSNNISDIIRTEFNAAITRIHERLDERLSEHQAQVVQQKQLEGRLEVLIAGLQSQRQEWDTLREDIRTLLRSEATTTTEIQNLKATLITLMGKNDSAQRDIARLEADVAHLSERRR